LVDGLLKEPVIYNVVQTMFSIGGPKHNGRPTLIGKSPGMLKRDQAVLARMD
jgi:hypothetical protein